MPTQHVLLVDDDGELRAAVAMLLHREGYEVSEVDHGAEALRVLRAGLAPHLILLDIEMPVMDGWKFCEARRGDKILLAIPVIIASASAGPSRENPYADVAAVLAKPFTGDALLAAVHHFARPVG